MSLKNVLVIGATGLLGPHIVLALAQSGSFNVSVLTTKNADDPKLASFKAQGVNVLHANYDDKSSLIHAFTGQDVVISTVGTAAFEKQALFIDAAVEAGVKRFFPSEFGTDVISDDLKGTPIIRDKLKILDKLTDLAAKGKISYTFVVTGPFIDWALKASFVGFDLANKSVTLYDEGKSLFVVTRLNDVAKFTVAALQHPEVSHNQTLRVGSFAVTQLQILEVLQKTTNQKFEVKAHVSTKDLERLAQEALAKGNVWEFITNALWSRIFSGKTNYPLDNAKFPEVKPATLEEVVQEAVA